MATFTDTPVRLESVFVQRDDGNNYYEQINISGSDLIVYLNEVGKIDADKISTWAEKYNFNTSSYHNSSNVKITSNGLYIYSNDDSAWYKIKIIGGSITCVLETP